MTCRLSPYSLFAPTATVAAALVLCRDYPAVVAEKTNATPQGNVLEEVRACRRAAMSSGHRRPRQQYVDNDNPAADARCVERHGWYALHGSASELREDRAIMSLSFLNATISLVFFVIWALIGEILIRRA